MVKTIHGRYSKKTRADILEFLKDNKERQYCIHDVMKIFSSLTKREVAHALGRLQKEGYITVALKLTCKDLDRHHNFYSYLRGDRKKYKKIHRKHRKHKKDKLKKRILREMIVKEESKSIKQMIETNALEIKQLKKEFEQMKKVIGI